MKFHTERNEVERSGVNSETAFCIKTTAKAFDILSSGLYTDNILAVIRELSCNAYDAHVAAGKKDVPFEIHLPNNLEPWFSVRDNGIGLSDDEVMNLYTTYFESTKTDSNDYIGALGLGSKSPFSYSSSFDVISRYNGKRRLYSVFINEHGVPTIALLGVFDTDEPNGIEVKLAIKPDDFYSFQSKTATVLKWFEVKPTIIGISNFQFEQIPEHTLRKENWMLLPRKYGGSYMTAVQGNIAYHVNLSQLSLDTETKEALSNSHLVAFFDIGELEVAASREEIRYDDRSKKALLDRVNSFCTEVVTEIEREVAPFSNSLWYATIELTNISSRTFGNQHSLRTFMENRSKDKLIQQYCKQKGQVVVPTTAGYDVFLYTRARYGKDKNLSRRAVRDGVFSPKGNIAVFVNDVTVGGVSRLTEFVKASSLYASVLVIRRAKDATHIIEDKNGDLRTHKMTEKDYQKEYKQLVEALGNPEVKLVSVDTPKAPPGSRGARNLPVFTFGGTERYTGRWDRRVVWKRLDGEEMVEFEIENGGLYFPLQSSTHIMTAVDGHRINWSADEVKIHLKTAVALINKHYPDYDFSMDDVYAMGTSAVKKVKKMDNWHNVFDLLRSIIPEYLTPVTSLKRRLSSQHCCEADYLFNKIRNDTFVQKVYDLDPSSPFRVMVEPIIEEYQQFSDVESVVSFLVDLDRKIGYNLYSEIAVTPYDLESMNKYPMLTLALSYDSSVEQYEIIFDYVKLIDRSAE